MKTKNILVLLTAVLLFALAGGGWYFFVEQDNNISISPTTETQERERIHEKEVACIESGRGFFYATTKRENVWNCENTAQSQCTNIKYGRGLGWHTTKREYIDGQCCSVEYETYDSNEYKEGWDFYCV